MTFAARLAGLREAWLIIRPHRHLLALGVLLVTLNRIASLVLPGSTKYLVDDVIGKQQIDQLPGLALALLGALVAQALSAFALEQVLGTTAHRLVCSLRCTVNAHVARLPMRFFDTTKSGVLMSRIMWDVEGARNLVSVGLIDLMGSIVTAGVVAVVLARINVAMAAPAIIATIAHAFVMRAGLSRMKGAFGDQRRATAELSGRLAESLGGIRVVKAYRAETREAEQFAAGARRVLAIALRILRINSLMSVGAALLLGGSSLLVLYMGVHEIAAGRLSVGGLVTFSVFLPMLSAPIGRLTGLGSQLAEALTAVERTRELLDQASEDDEDRRVQGVTQPKGEVVFDNVSFAYGDGPEVLRGVSFVARPGSVTALVGPSGAGKSTIIGLVSAFYSPCAGQIRLDDIDLTSVKLDDYRRRLGLVLQEPFLFDGTIRDNVRFGAPEATDEAMRAACRAAHVDEFVLRLPDGYDTTVGERGVRLSGGQKQRISIARAILANPRILVLDEATSNLDSESEALIQQGLKVLLDGRTTFVIAHRLSTIRRADQILVLDRGCIVERGTHDSLLDACGRYHSLYTKQYGLSALAPDIPVAGTART